MKINFKKTSVFIAFSIIFVLIAHFSYAQNILPSSAFCRAVLKVSSDVEHKSLNTQAQAEAVFLKKIQDLINKRLQSDRRQQELRAQVDFERAQRLLQAAKKVSGDRQRVALETFRLDVERAVNEQRATSDQILVNYRKNIDTIFFDQKNSFDVSLKSYTSGVHDALGRAQAGCSNSTNDPALTRINFIASLRILREQLVKDRQIGRSNFKLDISQLLRNKKIALELSSHTFKMALSLARQHLRNNLSSR